MNNNNNNNSSHSAASGSNSNSSSSSHHHHSHHPSSSPSRRWGDKRRLSSSSQQQAGPSNNNAATTTTTTTTTTSTWNLSALLAAGPTELLVLAVQLDESRQDPAVLQVPLETGGRLQHGANASGPDPEFVLALQYLRDHTKKPPSLLQSRNNSDSNNNSTKRATTNSSSFKNNNKGPNNPNSSTKDPLYYYALTPIILSGLLNVIQENKRQRQQQPQQAPTSNNSNNENDIDDDDDDTNDSLASDLWLTCHTLRRAALQRIRARQRRKRWQRRAVPWIVMTVLILWYRHSRAEWQRLLLERGYLMLPNQMVDCEDTPAYAPACHLAEAHLWYRYRAIVSGSMIQSATTTTNGTSWWDMLHPQIRLWWTTLVLPGRAITSSSAPLVLHTHLQLPPLIALHELNPNRNHNSRTGNHKNRVPPVRVPDAAHPCRWLGETVVNRMVRKTMEAHRPEHDPQFPSTRILDVGCGVGGTLYALWPTTETTTTTTTTGKQQGQQSNSNYPSFRYHGIAISAAEIHLARQQAEYHLRDQVVDRHHYDAVTFRQQSFDQPFFGSTTPAGEAHSKYTVAVAIESLSYSRNMEKTIRNIVDALESGGILIVADDVVLPLRPPSTDNVIEDNHAVAIRPSLVPHSAWIAAFQSAHCRVVEQQDLSLQYELSTTSTTTADSTTTESLSPPPLHHTDTLLAWGVVPVSLLPWEWISDTTSQRLLELHEERASLQRLAQQRQRGVERAELAYHWYVCVKEDKSEERAE